MKITAIIPARLDSRRFPRKVLYEFYGLPMIEHVRRRALLSNAFDDVYVATCDEEIASVIYSYGGKVIMTSNSHPNGTSRVAEAVKSINCSHVVLLQGDEPLFLPRHVEQLIEKIKQNPEIECWNLTAPIDNIEDLDQISIVKCTVSESGRIIYCYRRSPSISNFNIQKEFTRKVLGLIAFRKDFLEALVKLPISRIEEHESIEQMRVVENGFVFTSVDVMPSLPSVNEPSEVEIILDCLKNNQEQNLLLSEILQKF